MSFLKFISEGVIDPESRPASVSAVNKYLKSLGINQELVRGRGYFYFDGDGAENWRQTAVYCSKVSDIPFKTWHSEWIHLSKGYS